MAGNSRDSKILAYKDMVNQLNKTISAQTERIQSLQKTLEADPTWEQELPDDITVPEHAVASVVDPQIFVIGGGVSKAGDILFKYK